ncbi:MAG: helix-turn-helix domain-containing protein [Chloroflexota bacterium]
MQAPADKERTPDRHAQLLALLSQYAAPGDINISKIAEQLGVLRRTVIRDIKAPEDSGRLSLNGTVKIAYFRQSGQKSFIYRIGDAFSVGRDTALADLKAVWEKKQWNGEVSAS